MNGCCWMCRVRFPPLMDSSTPQFSFGSYPWIPKSARQFKQLTYKHQKGFRNSDPKEIRQVDSHTVHPSTNLHKGTHPDGGFRFTQQTNSGLLSSKYFAFRAPWCCFLIIDSEALLEEVWSPFSQGSTNPVLFKTNGTNRKYFPEPSYFIATNGWWWQYETLKTTVCLAVGWILLDTRIWI